uniref:vomeronasal secretory protein 2 n=1 Tax=Jaculus jaculus TaxID=51337 RepID=UPI00064CF2DA|nr:vomeronasal secretory protein 2 [Jaculus jaculus]
MSSWKTREAFLICEQSLEMKTPLLPVILFGLVAVLQAQNVLPLLSENQKLIGTWYETAAVTNKNMTEKKPKQTFPIVVTALEEGNLEAKVIFKLNGQCIHYDLVLMKMEEPGKYILLGANLHMNIYELPVKDHYILYYENNFFGNKILTGNLIGKNPEENLEALEEFKRFVQHKGLLPENIFVPEQREKCVPEHDKEHKLPAGIFPESLLLAANLGICAVTLHCDSHPDL